MRTLLFESKRLRFLLFILCIVFIAAGGYFLNIYSLLQKKYFSHPEEITHTLENRDGDIPLKPPTEDRSMPVFQWSSTVIQPEQVEQLIKLGADESSLQRIADSDYVRDNHRIYWIFPHPRIVEGADRNSFKVLDRLFAIDKNNLYITGIIAPEVDPTTFVGIGKDSINDLYFKDKNSVYLKEPVDVFDDYRYKLRKIPGADPATVRQIGDHSSNQIVADAEHVYFSGKEISGLDGKTFQVINKPYFADRNGTYFLDEKREEAFLLSSSTQVSILTNDSSHGGYAKIGDQVFFGSTTISGASTDTFHVFDADIQYGGKDRGPCEIASECPYATDKMTVYYFGKNIDDADVYTFTPIGYGILKGKDSSPRQPQYARDRNHIYYNNEIVENADPKTFAPLISGGYYFEYGSDEKSVYWKTKLIEGADPATFSIFEGQQPYEGCGAGRYSKDAHNVYYQNIHIEGADPATFKIKYGSDAFGEDAHNFYKAGEKADRSEFQECNYG